MRYDQDDGDYERRMERPNIAQEPVDGIEHLKELSRIYFYASLDAALIASALTLCYFALKAWSGVVNG